MDPGKTGVPSFTKFAHFQKGQPSASLCPESKGITSNYNDFTMILQGITKNYQELLTIPKMLLGFY